MSGEWLVTQSTQPGHPPVGRCSEYQHTLIQTGAPHSSKTLALYLSCVYLLTYLVSRHTKQDTSRVVLLCKLVSG